MTDCERMAKQRAGTYPGKLKIPRSPQLTPEEQEVETAFAAQIERDPEAAIRAYGEAYGNKISTDLARELWPEYRDSPEYRTRFADAVYQPSRRLAELVYERLLKEVPAEGKSNRVVFMAGGAGSGKTTAVGLLGEEDLPGTAQVVVNGSLADRQFAERAIQKALKAGKEVSILYVHRPAEKAVPLVIDRALKEGRPVSLDRIAELHYGAQQTVLHLAKKHHGRIRVIDNSGALKDLRRSSVDELAQGRYASLEDVKQRVYAAYEQEYAQRAAAGQPIADVLDRAFRRGLPRGGTRSAGGDGDPEPPGGDRPQRGGEGEDPPGGLSPLLRPP